MCREISWCAVEYNIIDCLFFNVSVRFKLTFHACFALRFYLDFRIIIFFDMANSVQCALLKKFEYMGIVYYSTYFDQVQGLIEHELTMLQKYNIFYH